MLRNRKGFTLIELMIVVVIIGILAAIAIPKFTQVSKSSKESEAGPVLKQMCTMALTYYDQYSGIAGSSAALSSVGWDAPSGKYYTFSFAGSGTRGTASASAITSGVVTNRSMDCETGAIS